MRRSYLRKWLACSLGLAFGLVAMGGRAQDPPTTLDALAEVGDLRPQPGDSAPPQGDAVHEVIRSPGVARVSEHIEKSPPSPINERPGVQPPGPNHQWIEGYWEWDKARKDFVWVTGTWHVPPAGSFWVNSHWRRDEKGWTRVSGFWSGRQDQRADWRTSGPPADRPEEAAGLAPGPDYFFVKGEYIPDGDGVVWRPGFWSRSYPAWKWAPARWVHESSGWAFQEGRWNRDANAGERRSPRPGTGSSVRGATIVSTPAEAGSPPRDASDPASAGTLPLLMSADPPLTAPLRPPGEDAPPPETGSNPIGSTLPPALTSTPPPAADGSLNPTAASPAGRFDQPYRGGPIESGQPNPSAFSPAQPNGDPDSGLPSAAGNSPFNDPRPPQTGSPTPHQEAFPSYTPGDVFPPDIYAPRDDRPGNPSYYRRGYNGGVLKKVFPRARGILKRVRPR